MKYFFFSPNLLLNFPLFGNLFTSALVWLKKFCSQQFDSRGFLWSKTSSSSILTHELVATLLQFLPVRAHSFRSSVLKELEDIEVVETEIWLDFESLKIKFLTFTLLE